MNRSREMKMAADADNGDDVHVCTRESIAQDFGDGNESSCYFCESPIFQSFVDAAVYRTSKLRRETMDGVQGFQAAYQPRDNMGALNLKFYPLRRVCVEIRACAMDPMQVFPAGRR